MNKYEPREEKKTCAKCKKEKRVGEFFAATNKPGEYLSQCIPCVHISRKVRGNKPPKEISDKTTWMNSDFEIFC